MRGVWLILFAAILWGTTGTAQELGPDAASPLAVGSLRLLLGTGVLVTIAALKRNGSGWRWLMRPATLFAAIGVAGFQLLFFSAIDRTGVAVGTLLALGSAAVLVGIFEAVSGAIPDRIWVAATTPAILGLAILAFSTRGDAAVTNTGLVLSLGAGASYATYIVSAARLAPLGSIRHSTAAVFSLAAFMLAPIAFSQDLSFLGAADGLLMVLWLSLATLTLAYLLFSAGLRDTDASTAATLSLAEPVTATILGVVVLAERPGPAAWLGIGLIIVGLIIVSRAERPRVVAHG